MYSLLFVVLLLCAVEILHAVDVARCSNGTESLNFTPYNDGVTGRYLVELCTSRVPDATFWRISLTYYDDENKCKNQTNNFHKPGRIHSIYKQSIRVDGNCSHICLSTTFDLIFNATYSIESTFLVDGNLRRHINRTCVTTNNTYALDDFKDNKALIDVRNPDKENVTITWNTGVPFEAFDMTICKIVNTTTGLEEEESSCQHLSDNNNCTAPSSLVINCRVALLDVCYRLTLTLYASWVSGVLQKQGLVTYQYCKKPLPDPAADGSNPVLLWAAAALAVLAAASVAARVVWGVLRKRTLHKAVLHEWLVHRNESTAVPGPVMPQRRHVLLLYAREGPAAARVTAALRSLLDHSPDTRVYDIFSAEVMSLAAAAPGEWVRGMLQRSDVSVLLLQTPALAALYHAPLQEADNTVRLAEPLLGRRVLYRAPQYGDTLLQYAVRLTAEAAHAQGNYHKYYIATLCELPTEIFPQLVPYRRYVLPAAGELLARDLCGAAPPDAALAALATAATEFAEHARDCPDYLRDELMPL